MRLKFYLMGLGIGVIVAAVIMGIAMRGRTREMTDEEIMARARQLGMVEAGTLAEIPAGENNQSADQNRETVEQQTPQETPAAQTVASVAESGSPAGEESSEDAAGTDASSGAETGESTGALNGTDGTVADPGLVVEGEPVDDEEETETAAEEAAGTDPAASDNTADREQSVPGNTAVADTNRENENSDASGTGASVTQTGATASGSSTGSGSIVVTIPDGLYSEDIASLLENAGVVDNAAAFNDYLVNSGMDRYITVGARLIPRGASYEDVARIITGR